MRNFALLSFVLFSGLVLADDFEPDANFFIVQPDQVKISLIQVYRGYVFRFHSVVFEIEGLGEITGCQAMDDYNPRKFLEQQTELIENAKRAGLVILVPSSLTLGGCSSNGGLKTGQYFLPGE